ncbi:hypothetical protein LZ519_10370 [Sphingomonas sp. RG327]|uniref:Uncharacterized protein n=1 Tax=Sphingomonas anseongensis TaxID=2908207 RepID=A0ABT0RHG0_9SPHN|nr:hypothetical protein [Sphingomonas anseongensis]MCL6679713.1 hypothetical protein [Sphingomonas anseongensis]
MSRWWLVALVLTAALVRELIVWLGYSWIVATSVAIILMVAFFLLSIRRLHKR